MIKLINKLTGSEMWVADSRLEEYLKQGHALASASGAEPEKPTSEEQPQAKKRTTRKK